MTFLQRMEDGLAVDAAAAASYDDLRQQLCTHKVTDAAAAFGRAFANGGVC